MSFPGKLCLCEKTTKYLTLEQIDLLLQRMKLLHVAKTYSLRRDNQAFLPAVVAYFPFALVSFLLWLSP